MFLPERKVVSMLMMMMEGYVDDDDVDRRSSIVASTYFFLFVLYRGRVRTGRESTQCRRMTMQTEKKGWEKRRRREKKGAPSSITIESLAS